MSSNSANEDDPHSSGEDWRETEKKRNKRRLSTRLSKKPRVILADAFSSEDESEDEKDYRRKRNGGYKKPKVVPTSIPQLEEKEIPMLAKQLIPLTNQPDYTSGSFVILKTDAENFNPASPAHIWRIDGKALLQKFEPFKEENGELKYRNTSVYTGWSNMECDKYAPVKDINILYNTNNKLVLSFDWRQIAIDSD